MKRIQRRSPALENKRHQRDNLLENLYRARGSSRSLAQQLSTRDLYSPAEFLGLDQAAKLVIRHLGKPILIVGDYDADGATSTALIVLALRAMGAKSVTYTVPDRFTEGYGLSAAIVNRLDAPSPSLIITVDNGISSIDGVAAARARGIDVVITDHHLPGKQLPEANAIVNPNQAGCHFPGKNSAGVGVVFYLMTEIKRQLSLSEWFDEKRLTPPNLAEYLDLVALGTYADLVPLDQNNRILIRQGLARIRAGQCREGIRSLMDIAGKTLDRISESDFGFLVAPRLNAAGRLEDMSIGIECLLTDDPERATELAFQLDQLNRSRKEIESEMKREAEQRIKTLSDKLGSQEANRGICMFSETWHEGVVGILASRVKEQCGKPCFMFAPESDSGDLSDPCIKGSGRSVSGIHLRDLLETINRLEPGLILRFGGHAMAAGLTLKQSSLQTFDRLFQSCLDRDFEAHLFQSLVLTDGELSAELIAEETAMKLGDAGPWGQGFPAPTFDGKFTVIDKRVLKGLHLKLILRTEDGREVDAIAFNSPWTEYPLPTDIRIAYALDMNHFRGRSALQLNIFHIEAA